MSTVAVIGLGAMGSRIAGRLLADGHEVVVWNRTPARGYPLVEKGALQASDPAGAARQAEVVVTMVSNSGALQDVLEGPSGIAAGISADATLVQMSTVGPAAVPRVRSAVPSGVKLLDAPVLGSIGEAEGGSLTIFVGGDDAHVARWKPLLGALGTVLHVGPFGAGQAAKLVANGTLFLALSGVGEALALAESLGLSRDAALDVLATSPLAAQAERRRSAVESGDYPLRFSLALARKDAGLIAEAATDSGVDLRATNAAMTWLHDVAAADPERTDYASVLARILDQRLKDGLE